MNENKMDLTEKLKQFESNFHAAESNSRERKCADIEQFVPGEEVTNACGSYFRSVTVYPEDHRHGEILLNLIWECDPSIFRLVGNDESLSHFDLRKTIFIDTETTGLAGGVGTLPFMVGMGYFTDEGFQVEQLLMRDYDEEYAVLWAVQNRLQNSEMLISYNGKCYDMNILSSRFTLARMENSAVDLPHLDLLFSVRRLWRRRISDCSLSNVERSVLGFFRENDIPSYLIPNLYFNYLRSRDGRLLEPVFSHNRWDIVTLVVLTALIGQIYQYPQAYLKHPLDLLSLGKAFGNMFRLNEAVVCFREALNYPGESEECEEILRLLGFSLKRQGEWDHAVKVWEHLVKSYPHRISAYEELAKYFEHWIRDIERAMEVVQQALEQIHIMEELNSNLSIREDRKDLEYRLTRLQRKLDKKWKTKNEG